MLPLTLVVNATFPYDEELEAARRFLAVRGITNPRPIRRSVPHSEAYEAWLARTRPKLRLVKDRAGH